MTKNLPLRAAAVLLVIAMAIAIGWYLASPHHALSRLSDYEIGAEERLQLYDREKLRAAFEAQMEPSVDDLPPPITKDVLLDALTAPEAVRLLVMEPYGEWQFAAADGLAPEVKAQIAGPDDSAGSMPRMLETAESWEFERRGLSELTARPADEGWRESRTHHSYRFERDGLGWKLVAIELAHPIR